MKSFPAIKQMVVRTTVIVLPLVFAGALAAAGRLAPAASVAQDKGKELFEVTCMGCHGVDLVTPLRKTQQEWSELVQSMIDKGAYIKKEDIPVLIDYLAVNLGVKQETPAKKDAPSGPTAGGAAARPSDEDIQKLVEGVCASCHGIELVTEKRGTKDDWNDTVLRMVQRGAEMKEDQIPATVEYLAKKYPAQ